MFNKSIARIKFDIEYPNYSSIEKEARKIKPLTKKELKKRKNTKYLNTLKWRLKNPLKVKAYRLVFSALRNGSLAKLPCFCGKIAEAHHKDYSKPLDIEWLCKEHHELTHHHQ